MCLYPRLIDNRKYKVTKKNGGNVPKKKDPRVSMVPVGCGKCIECRKQRGRGWSLRLQEEVRNNKNGHFITLTFSTEGLKEIAEKIHKIGPMEGYILDNEIATVAIREFLEKWRHRYGKSLKHWFITELGQTKTEHIHIHGIIWTRQKASKEQVKKAIGEQWNKGMIWVGDYCTEQTVNYVIKYVTKTDPLHKEYTPKVLTSPGIGAGYMERKDSKRNKYNGDKTKEEYVTRQGYKIAMPTYWRNKIYSEEEREQLWINRLEKKERYVMGTRIDISQGDKEYWATVEYARAKNARLGYGNDEKDWDRINYENQRRKLIQEKRIGKEANKE
ncbi:MAG: replication initiator protein [Microviridae sp.]|nr:MAG: replication initiator protein [Microviridae sp.]